MAANRVADLTIEEFRALIRETVEEVLVDLMEDYDPDEGLEFRPEVADYLRTALKERKRGTPLRDVIKELESETSTGQKLK
jgi:hypothetical protein